MHGLRTEGRCFFATWSYTGPRGGAGSVFCCFSSRGCPVTPDSRPSRLALAPRPCLASRLHASSPSTTKHQGTAPQKKNGTAGPGTRCWAEGWRLLGPDPIRAGCKGYTPRRRQGAGAATGPPTPRLGLRGAALGGPVCLFVLNLIA